MGWTRTPPRIAPTGWSRNANDVARPKFPPPPRTPQNKSGFSCSFACVTRPSAVTRSTPRRLSQARPRVRARKPDPPPSVSPATPVAGTTPPVVANPTRCAACSNSPHVTPPAPRREGGRPCKGLAVPRSFHGSVLRPDPCEKGGQDEHRRNADSGKYRANAYRTAERSRSRAGPMERQERDEVRRVRNEDPQHDQRHGCP